MMFKKLVAGIILFLGIASVVLAIPQYLNYQGILRDKATGNLIDGSREMTFKIYNVSTEGTALWTMPPSNVVVSGGLYNVGIGPVGYAELASGPRWLEVEVGGERLSPRTELLAVAYAVTAVTAETAAYAYTAGAASSATTATSATTAASATYATLSGTASSAESVRGPVSAEANATDGYALFINNSNNGRIGVRTSGAGTSGDHAIGAVGIMNFDGANANIRVYNDCLTNNSIILLTVGTVAHTAGAGTTPALRISDANATQKWFEVKTGDNSTPVNAVYFSYLIIN